MTDYLGLPVLEQRSNARDEDNTGFHRDTYNFDPKHGKRNVRTKDIAPSLDNSYLWTCKNKAEIVALKQWFFNRRGMLVPFWVPTWRQDLLLAQDSLSGDTSILVQPCGYTRHAFPVHARRHLAIHFNDGSIIYRNITTATDNGISETLAFSGALGKALANWSWVSYLLYCRLSSDDLTINYHTDSIAEATIHYREIPAEAP